MTMPNFLVIGAAKAGTTALYHYLNQHPEIYMSPVKETNFFALEGEELNFCGPGDQAVLRRSKIVSSVTSIEEYRGLFGRVSGEKAIGEASPLYLYSPKAPERIRHYIPEAKLIAVLRNPVERAYSNFLMMIRYGSREPITDFSRALQEEERRIKDNWEHTWHYKRMGFYHAQLKRYFDTFDRDQIRVYLYEDLTDKSDGVLQHIFRFLDVDDTFSPDMSSRHNVSGIPKNKALHDFLRKKHPIKSILKPLTPEGLRQRIITSLQNRNLEKPPLSPEVRRQLVEAYREDILKLQDLIQRDLTKWLE